MRVDPDGRTAKEHLAVRVRVRALVLVWAAELFHRLVDGHRVRQYVVANQQLNAMSSAAVGYRHCGLAHSHVNQHQSNATQQQNRRQSAW